MGKSKNITWHNSTITKQDRQSLNGHKSCVLWFTGLSGSGKSTLANAVDNSLYHEQCKSYVLDGDNIRHGLNKDLSFKKEDRQENIRRIGEVARLFVDSGQIVTTAFISPFREDRDMVRRMFPENEFIEVFVDCPIDVCEDRDPKGLYKKARNGEIPNFTGISSPYEAPNLPEITIRTDELSIGQSVDKIITYLQAKKIL
ncbi:MAG: adenylyl-sulfate kinase [Bacillota bacterium]